MNQEKFVDEEAPQGAVSEVSSQDVLGTLALRAADRRSIRNMAGRVRKNGLGMPKDQPLPSQRLLKLQKKVRKELRKKYKKTTYQAIELLDSTIDRIIDTPLKYLSSTEKARIILKFEDAITYLAGVIQGKYPIEQKYIDAFIREEKEDGRDKDIDERSDTSENQLNREEGVNSPERIESEQQA